MSIEKLPKIKTQVTSKAKTSKGAAKPTTKTENVNLFAKGSKTVTKTQTSNPFAKDVSKTSTETKGSTNIFTTGFNAGVQNAKRPTTRFNSIFDKQQQDKFDTSLGNRLSGGRMGDIGDTVDFSHHGHHNDIPGGHHNNDFQHHDAPHHNPNNALSHRHGDYRRPDYHRPNGVTEGPRGAFSAQLKYGYNFLPDWNYGNYASTPSTIMQMRL